ncbi:hypothetical protein [Legionella yabuuchiae]|uniref:hypothetical protein n=1 Tax=Legionella yabuuchiae TaxID=376727 RepID=UPI001056A8B7|nr:hypothetical protein [Legionella yabuuchiae]
MILHETPPNISGSFLLSCLGYSAIAGMFGVVAYVNYKVNFEPRERVILAEVKIPQALQSIIDGDDTVSSKSTSLSNGSLKNDVIDVGDYNGNIRFMKKGAQSRDKLIKEYMVGSALHMLDPDVQPESHIIMEPTEKRGVGQFFTLSEIKPASKDVEDFILNEDWRAKIKEKPIKNVGATLSKVALIAGQQDCKLANLVIVDMGAHYEISVIDHELSGIRFFSINERLASLDAQKLVRMIRDKNDPQYALHGTQDVKDFMDYLEQQISKDEIINFHKKVQSTSFDSLIEELEHKKTASTLVTQDDIEIWKKEFLTWKETSQQFLKKYDSTAEQSSSLTV